MGNFKFSKSKQSKREKEKQKRESTVNLIPLPFPHTLDKNDTNNMIKATPAMSPIRIASVFSISSSSLLVSTYTKIEEKRKNLLRLAPR